MAKAVVNRLEAVEIEMAHGHQAAVALGARQGLCQAVAQQHTVGYAGQRVVMRQMFQLLLVFHSFRGVDCQPDDAPDAAILVQQAHPGHFQQVCATVCKHQPLLGKMWCALLQAVAVCQPATGGKGRCQEIGIMGGGKKPRLAGAYGVAQTAVDEAHPAIRVHHPDGQRRIVQHCLQQGLLVGRRLNK